MPTPTPAKPAIGIVTLGVSVFLGADLVGPNYPDQAMFIADKTPSRYFAKAPTAVRRPIDGLVLL